MGRGKIEIKRIENPTNRQVTYSKRRNGIFKKAQELAVLCDAKVSLIMFSNTGKFHEYISPSITTKKIYDEYQKALGIDLWSTHYEVFALLSLSHRIGEELNDLSIEELGGLEQKMDASLTIVRERKAYEMAKEEGGWIPVVRQRGMQERRRHGGCRDVFTIFVDNLPTLVSPKRLYTLFNKFGVVQDVFIPYKRRRTTNTRFGFVRFDCLVAATIAVQKANGLWMDDKAIEVKHANLGKEKLEGVVSTKPEAVRGKPCVARENITLKAEEIGNGWLYESVVVRLKESYATVNLKKEIEAIEVEDVLVRESGGRGVVITFRSKEEMVQRLKPIKELIMEWCEIISEGKSGLVLEQEKSVWLSCYGIPLNLWNSTNVKRIGGLWAIFCTAREI
ncbi:hypothetical protein TEA_028515 [Camellia sinensis var. sinensis]|uniref:RRM domain-containing protein n=1 Tax=Camellia sinensis var. sinensis TaxID=542762 RepID=A0A4S4ESW9_CAMSN|nr:hypothetical protein TEA_028515 [Camellia sinensis var. sinensis]